MMPGVVADGEAMLPHITRTLTAASTRPETEVIAALSIAGTVGVGSAWVWGKRGVGVQQEAGSVEMMWV